MEGFSSAELNEKLQYADFFILISSQNLNKQEVLPTYYIRQSIEQIFGFTKSCNNILPLRVLYARINKWIRNACIFVGYFIYYNALKTSRMLFYRTGFVNFTRTQS